MLHKVKTGKTNDECYSILWKAPKGNYQITGIQDNERNIFYDIYNIEDLIKFIKDLNIKEQIRQESYKHITESFEKTIKQAEDRYLDLWEKIENGEFNDKRKTPLSREESKCWID